MLRLRLCTRHVASFRAAALAVNVALPSTTSQAFNPAGGFIMGGFSASIAVQPKRSCSTEAGAGEETMTESAYHDLADAWIGSLEESLEALDDVLDDFDINNAQGVLNLQLGEHGTYVLNKQAPNREIWWSSPVSGPKRFAWDSQTQEWLGTRDGAELLSLLEAELQGIFPAFALGAQGVRQEALTRMAAL